MTSKQEIKSQVKEEFEQNGEVVFEEDDFLEDESNFDEVHSTLKELTEGGLFYCQTAFRCEEGHPSIRFSGIPEHYNPDRREGPPYCSLCEEHVTLGELEPDCMFCLSEEMRDEWSDD